MSSENFHVIATSLKRRGRSVRRGNLPFNNEIASGEERLRNDRLIMQ